MEIWGEGTDRADKATNKALASAYKYAAFQVFCIPVAGQVDGDAETIRLGAASPSSAILEPVHGWSQWTRDIIDMVKACQTEEAVHRLQATYRRELHALSTADAAGYRQIGEAVSALRRRLTKLQPRAKADAAMPADPATHATVASSRRKAASATVVAPCAEEVGHAAAAA